MENNRTKIALDHVEDPFIAMRTTTDDEDLDELMASMKEIGLVEPIVVRAIGDKFEVIAGHRRTRAARLLGWAIIDAVVVVADDDTAFAMRLAENISRKDVDPVDQACFVGEIMQRYNYDVPKMASMLKRSENWINERLEIFSMPDYLQNFLRLKHISLGAALWLNRISDDRIKRYYSFWADQNGCSVASAKKWHDDIAARKSDFAVNEVPPTDPAAPTQTIRASTKCALCHNQVFLDEAHSIFVHPDCVSRKQDPSE